MHQDQLAVLEHAVVSLPAMDLQSLAGYLGYLCHLAKTCVLPAPERHPTPAVLERLIKPLVALAAPRHPSLAVATLALFFAFAKLRGGSELRESYRQFHAAVARLPLDPCDQTAVAILADSNITFMDSRP